MRAPARSKPIASALKRPRAMTLAETVVAMVVVSVLLVAALNTVGAAGRDRRMIDDNARATLLAGDLMTEIRAQAYEDPTSPGGFGLEAGEAGANRLNFDDIDDYDGYSSTPPKTRDGAVLAGCSIFTRSASVTRVSLAALDTPQIADGGVRKIVVTVSIGSRPVASLTSYRTRSAHFRNE